MVKAKQRTNKPRDEQGEMGIDKREKWITNQHLAVWDQTLVGGVRVRVLCCRSFEAKRTRSGTARRTEGWRPR